MIVLGEPVISIALNQFGEGKEKDLYYGIGVSFAIIFCIYSLYFHLNPPPNLHAIRRSIFTSFLFNYSHWVLSASILTMGVGLRKFIENITTHVSKEESWILCGGLSASLISMVIIRKTHFFLRKMDSIPFFIKTIWWGMIYIFALTPLIFGPFFEKLTCLVILLSLTVINLLCVILETVITHHLESRYGHSNYSHLLNQESTEENHNNHNH